MISVTTFLIVVGVIGLCIFAFMYLLKKNEYHQEEQFDYGLKSYDESDYYMFGANQDE